MTVGISPESGGRAFPGQAEANEEAELSFWVGGSLIEVSANVGDAVKKGQVLASSIRRTSKCACAQLRRS
jgi:multidrug efflux pump subunit AcrA (membrane-fusion protein)